MTSAKRWILPDGVEEILPDEARKLESLRREILDLYQCWGYELVIPPLIEFLDSLLVGSSHDLDLHTFKITDQLSGRMMGIRADITPQAARIDAHCLNREGVVRLCYADNVLHTRPRGLMTSRVPIRVGAELYGEAGVASDIELICLMVEMLQIADIGELFLVLGHVGIFRTLVQEASLDENTERILFEAVQRKAYAEIDEILDASGGKSGVNKGPCELLQKLVRLSGDQSVLEEAGKVFKKAPANVKAALQELVDIADGVRERLPTAELCFDLCELRGYAYHTGIVFGAYSPNYGRPVAKGGRYDSIGEVFGRSRPASGFDSDLKTLAKLTNRQFRQQPGILTPNVVDEELQVMEKELRASGETVVRNLTGKQLKAAEIAELNCDRELVSADGTWKVVKL